MSKDTMIDAEITRIINNRKLTDSTFILTMDRKGMKFLPGQHVVVGPINDIERREYSIYSGVNDDKLSILVKEVEDGNISIKLNQLKSGDELELEGPFGQFIIQPEDVKTKQFLFIATGTGIAPFHSFIQSYPELNYKLLHGISYQNEAYDNKVYNKKRLHVCTSKEKCFGFKGRVTDYLKQHPVKDFNNTLVYVCGNGNMIYDVYDILKKQGMQSDQFFTEVYF